MNRFSMTKTFPHLVRLLDDADRSIPLYHQDRQVGLVDPRSELGTAVLLTLPSKDHYASGELAFEPDIEVIERNADGETTKIRVLAFHLVRVRQNP